MTSGREQVRCCVHRTSPLWGRVATTRTICPSTVGAWATAQHSRLVLTRRNDW